MQLNRKKSNWAELNRHHSKSDTNRAKRHVKRWLPAVLTGAMQIRTEVRDHLISVGTAIIQKARDNRY